MAAAQRRGEARCHELPRVQQAIATHGAAHRRPLLPAPRLPWPPQAAARGGRPRRGRAGRGGGGSRIDRTALRRPTPAAPCPPQCLRPSAHRSESLPAGQTHGGPRCRQGRGARLSRRRRKRRRRRRGPKHRPAVRCIPSTRPGALTSLPSPPAGGQRGHQPATAASCPRGAASRKLGWKLGGVAAVCVVALVERLTRSRLFVQNVRQPPATDQMCIWAAFSRSRVPLRGSTAPPTTLASSTPSPSSPAHRGGGLRAPQNPQLNDR